MVKQMDEEGFETVLTRSLRNWMSERNFSRKHRKNEQRVSCCKVYNCWISNLN
jgi:hypothetical protein